MKKKILALALAGVLVVGALTGCGSSKSESSEKKTDDKKITVAASATPHAEILEEAKTLLKELGLIKNVPTLVSCPTCGRIQYDLIPVAKEIEDFLNNIHQDITVAIMGCAVNGPGEAKNADIGIAGGVKEGLLIKKGKIIKKVKQEDMVQTLKDEILKMVNS